MNSQWSSAPELLCKGRFYLAHNNPQLALAALNQAIKLDRDFATVGYFCRESVYERLRQYRQAIQDLNALIELDLKNPWIFYRRAYNYRMMEKYKLEIADDSTAIFLEPKFKGAYIDRAWAFDKIGLHELAEKDRKSAKTLPGQIVKLSIAGIRCTFPATRFSINNTSDPARLILAGFRVITRS